MPCYSENDLPLMSNIKDMLVSHYMFNFSCSFDKKCFTSCLLLILEPSTDKGETSECSCEIFLSKLNSAVSCDILNHKESFMLILDCYKILVHNVEEIILTNSQIENIKFKGFNPSSFCAREKLKFSSDNWSLKIWKDSCFCKFCFPKAIRLSYATIADGPSLLWVTDQDKNPAVFTYGAWVNNRSLFPCQEPPSAMATWEATVDVVGDLAIVLMSGEEDAQVRSEEGRNYYYYFTRSVLPMSTLCLAVGFWQEHRILNTIRSGPKCRIFAPSNLIDKAVQELFEYVPYCLKISEDVFGPYPFPRIDFLIVPPTFGSLGMARTTLLTLRVHILFEFVSNSLSHLHVTPKFPKTILLRTTPGGVFRPALFISPNIVFLSQSLLTGDASLSSRIAHEIAHGWFGLLIGASDWSEEWLSEGFATFVEDYFHARTMNVSEEDARHYTEVKTHIRLKTLLQEISNTSEDLQVLRPSRGETVVKTVDGVSAAVLKDGQNPTKAFIQVHYIKLMDEDGILGKSGFKQGYFLLKHLAGIVGIGEFMNFLKGYIEKYQGKLVTSKEFLTEFFLWFPSVQLQLSMEKIYEEWLHNPGIPHETKNMNPSSDNKLYKTALKEVQKWKNLNDFYLKKRKKRRKYDFDQFGMILLTSEQLIIFLESLLDESRVSVHTLKHLYEHFNFSSANAEVQHRWFELVVKYKYKSSYVELQKFLTDHLAMGVYLFGEMIFSEDTRLKIMAQDTYMALKSDMEPNYVSTIDQMLQDAK